MAFISVLSLPLSAMEKNKFQRPRSKSNPKISELMLNVSKAADGAHLPFVSKVALSLTDQETHPTAVYTRALKAKTPRERSELMAKAALIDVDRVSDSKKAAAGKLFNDSIKLAHENWTNIPIYRRHKNAREENCCLRTYESEMRKAQSFYREFLRAEKRENNNLPVDEPDLEKEVTIYFLKVHYEWELESAVYYADELRGSLAKSLSPRSHIAPLIKLIQEEKVDKEVSELLESLDKAGISADRNSLPSDASNTSAAIRKDSNPGTFSRVSMEIKSKADLATYQVANELMAEQLVRHLLASKTYFTQWQRKVKPEITEQALQEHTNACFDLFKQTLLENKNDEKK